MANNKVQHSVKVPRLYKVATSVLKSFQDGRGSVKTLVYEAKKKHPNVKALFALVTECIKYQADLEAAFSSLNILTIEKPLDKNLALILATELIFGKKSLPGESKPIKTVLRYKNELENAIKDKGQQPRNQCKNPRYVRVNLLKTTMELAIVQFQREGLILKSTPKNYEEFTLAIRDLNDDEFMLDFHMPQYLLVFPCKKQFYDHPLYLDGSVVLQDKASCMSVEALNPPKNAVLLDACAAPGMKTCQAVATVGKVIAVERNAKRFKVLKEILDKHCRGADYEVLHSDFLQLNPEDFPNVEYMVVDPTCSGSGTLDHSTKNDSERLAKLANLQSMILKHAFKFPGLKKLAYSTCSVNVEENENVVEDVLKDVKDQFKLVSAMPNWTRRGLDGHEKCIRVDPELDLCTGFFVAVFKRKK